MKKFILFFIALFLFVNFVGCKGDEKMEYQIDSILNYKILQNVCIVSNVAIVKLENKSNDISRYLKYQTKNCKLDSAVYDSKNNKIIVKFSNASNAERVEIFVERGDYSHSVSTAEATLKSLDSKAVAAKENSCIMIGDSLFANWVNPQVDMSFTSPLYNFGVGGFCVSDLSNIVFYRFVLPVNPSKIIMHVGVNDIFQAGISAENYFEQIIEFLSLVKLYLPNCEIYFVSIVRPTDAAPTVTGIIGEGADLRRNEIDIANQQVKDYCEQTGIALYVNGENAYCDDLGRSIIDLFYGDGIHLLPNAYPKWGTEIAKSLK